MKILYHIPYPDSIGADRWIYEGWRDAFLDLGHEFFELTATDSLLAKTEVVKPDIFMTSINLINFSQDIPILQNIRRKGIKIFLWVDWPRKEEEIDILKNKDVACVYFGEREPESMEGFEKMTGKRYHLIPNAANKKLHFPTIPTKKYNYDIVYLGTYLPKKKWFFKEILLPLKKRYKVGIFGPNWSSKDNFFRLTQGLFRKIKFKEGVDFLNKLRIVVPPEEENQLYSSAKISLNFHEREKDGSQPHYILNQRTFKIPACGGFEICDYVPALRKYFAEDEMVMATDKNDWFEKIEYYLKHEKERKKIQEKGIARALAEHTYHNRLQQILDFYKRL